MGITSKTKSENWGMGFLLVFFPEDQQPTLSTATSSSSSSSSSSSLFKSTATPLRRTTPNNNPHSLIILSIFALLFFLSLLLLSLQPSPTNHLTPRSRLLLLSPSKITNLPSPSALQKMGLLHRRGTIGMHDLIVGHVSETLSALDLRFFLRSYQFSNLASKSDLVLIFPSNNRNRYQSVISEEIESFSTLNFTRFVKLTNKDTEPIWGKKIRNISNFTTNFTTVPSYGSIVSFVADELDPENSLSGFLDHVAMGLRRWACYPMLLGRVRRNFKHIILIDAREVFLLGDPLGRARAWPSESVQFSTDVTGTVSVANGNNKHGSSKKHSAELKRVNSALVLGDVRGVRRVANAMLAEIVRFATSAQHKKRNSVSDSAILNQLVGNEHLLKSVNVKVFFESVPDVSSLGRINSNSGSLLDLAKFTVVRRGNGNILDVNSVIRKHICFSLPVNSSVYRDC